MQHQDWIGEIVRDTLNAMDNADLLPGTLMGNKAVREFVEDLAVQAFEKGEDRIRARLRDSL